ncbi:DELLA protein GAIP-B [Spatholobus suberectus]|nr:DELLA protein GAIP-B [Spatholobus suberectus]
MNSVFKFHKILARLGVVEKVLSVVWQIWPEILIVVVEQEVNHNGLSFMDRFTKSLHYCLLEEPDIIGLQNYWLVRRGGATVSGTEEVAVTKEDVDGLRRKRRRLWQRKGKCLAGVISSPRFVRINGRCLQPYNSLASRGHAIVFRRLNVLRPLQANMWLAALLLDHGENIYRMKGLLSIQGMNERFVFQGVHDIFQYSPERLWGPDEPRINKIVFVGKNLDAKELEKGSLSV